MKGNLLAKRNSSENSFCGFSVIGAEFFRPPWKITLKIRHAPKTAKLKKKRKWRRWGVENRAKFLASHNHAFFSLFFSVFSAELFLFQRHVTSDSDLNFIPVSLKIAWLLPVSVFLSSSVCSNSYWSIWTGKRRSGNTGFFLQFSDCFAHQKYHLSLPFNSYTVTKLTREKLQNGP